MKYPRRTLVAFWAIALSLFPLASFGQGTGFTYQGALVSGNFPVTGKYDFRFRLYDLITNGNLVTLPLINTNVLVTNGVFTTRIDFGSGVFNGNNFWLDIGVRTNGGTLFTLLSPRQPISPSPYAVFAGTSLGATNLPPTSSLLVSANAVLQSPTNFFAANSNAIIGAIGVSGYLSGNAAPVILTNSGNAIGGDGSHLLNLNPNALQGTWLNPILSGLMNFGPIRIATNATYNWNPNSLNPALYLPDGGMIELGTLGDFMDSYNHDGAPELGIVANHRVAIAWGNANNANAEFQNGVAYQPGRAQNSSGSEYWQGSNFGDTSGSNDLGYSIGLYAKAPSRGNALVANMFRRAEATDLVGGVAWVYYAATNTSPLIGQSPGPKAGVEVWGGPNGARTVLHGGLTHDIVSVPVFSSYGVTFDSAQEIILNLFTNLVITNATPLYNRTNQADTATVWINPGLNNFSVTLPTNYIPAGAGNSDPVPLTNALANSQTELILKQRIFSGSIFYTYTWNRYYYANQPDQDVVNYFKFISANGGTITAGQSNAVYQLVLAEKADGTWYLNDCIYPCIGTNGFQQGINLRNTNLYNISWSGSVTFNTSGVTGDGSTGYGNTGFIPSTAPSPAYQSTAASVSVYSAGIAPSGVWLGVNDYNQNAARLGQQSPTLAYGLGPNGVDTSFSQVVSNLNGFFCSTRTSSTEVDIYVMGNVRGNGQTAATAVPTMPFFVLARNSQGSPADFSNGTFNYFSIGGAKSAAMEAAEAADVLAFETALGRK